MMRLSSTRGGSLLEVMVAMMVLASAALGVIGAQLSIVRAERQAAWRAHALWIADSRAEAERSGAGTRADWDSAVAVLPAGRLVTVDAMPGVRTVTIRWNSPEREAPVDARCATRFRAGVRCVALAFASGGHP
ncbi:type IV pilus modification PilV family protein [Burkholderia alba]|uniref:type IV pilus modification PilV family protein n=1 Tax=Burkholderia alba TaxID=2683677 RepID=UPI002B05FA27|nr:hypothetical protein [Burkholderia alba]